jgi:hypothetical protein
MSGGGSFSGSYTDLTDKPALFSGAYADLTGKPAAQILQAPQWNTLHNLGTGNRYLVGDLVFNAGTIYQAIADNESQFTAVGDPIYWRNLGTGIRLQTDYLDLANKPTIPTSFSSLVNGAYTVSLSTTGQLNLPSAANNESNNARIQSANSIDILSNLSKWTFGTDGDLTLPSGGTITEDGGLTGAIRLTPAGGANEYQALVIYPTAAGDGDHIHLTAGGGTTDLYLGNDLQYVKIENGGNVVIQADDGANTNQWLFDTNGDLTAPRNIVLNNPVTTVIESVTGTVADSNGNPFTFRILKADNPQLITPFADPNFVLKWTGTDAGSVAAAAQAPGGQGPSSIVSDDGTYWNFNSWFGLNTSRPNTGTVFTVEYGVVVSDTMISTTVTNLVIEADDEQWKFGTDGVLTLPDNSVIASYKPVTVIAGPTGVQTISDNASATRLTFIESVDSVGAFTNSIFTVPYTGYYQFNATVYFTSNVTLTDGFLVIVNTTSGLNELDTLYYGAHTGRVINGSSMQYLTAGDTVALFFRQVSGNVVDIGSSSRLTIHRVSIG